MCSPWTKSWRFGRNMEMEMEGGKRNWDVRFTIFEFWTEIFSFCFELFCFHIIFSLHYSFSLYTFSSSHINSSPLLHFHYPFSLLYFSFLYHFFSLYFYLLFISIVFLFFYFSFFPCSINPLIIPFFLSELEK